MTTRITKTDPARAKVDEFGSPSNPPAGTGILDDFCSADAPQDVFAHESRVPSPESRVSRLGLPILLAQAPTANPRGKDLKDTKAAIVSNLPKNMQATATRALADPSSQLGKNLLALYDLTKEKDGNSFFSLGILRLVELGIIKNLDDLSGETGRRVFVVASLAKERSGDLFIYAFQKIVDYTYTPSTTEHAMILSKQEFKAAFLEDNGWVDNLAKAAGAMNLEEGWKGILYGIGTLMDVGIITKDTLKDSFIYEEGYMLFEMAKATHTLYAGADYFGSLLWDWLMETGATRLDSKTIGTFIKETAPAAQAFYEAGKRQRERAGKRQGTQASGDLPPLWNQAIRNHRGLLPVKDMPKILTLMAKMLDDPMDRSLVQYIEQELKLNILNPKTREDLRLARYYGEFIESITQEAGLKQKWFQANVELTNLAAVYKTRSPEEIFELAMVLNSTVGGMGDEWLKTSKFDAPRWDGAGEPIDVPVDITTVQSVYARHYLIKVLKPGDLKKYKFIWQNGKPGAITVANLANMMLAYSWIKEIFGENSAVQTVMVASMTCKKPDLRGVPENILTLKGLHAMRMQMNEISSSMTREDGGHIKMGDTYVSCLSEMLNGAIILGDNDPLSRNGDYVSIGLMVKLLFGWSDLESIADAPQASDLMGNYESLAGYVAASVSGYFENHPEDLARYEGAAIRLKLKALGHPLKTDKARKDMGDELEDFLMKGMR